MSAFTGTARLVRLAIRRDRIQLPLWIAGTAVFVPIVVASVRDRFPTEADRVEILRSATESPALLVLRTAPTGASEGAMIMFSLLTYVAVLAGLMSTLAVVRHTRQNEETGRSEMVGATVVGRHAGLTAALVVVAGANLVLGGLIALALIGYGQPAAGSIGAGAGIAAVGIVFAGVAAVAAQITQSSRAANGIAAAVVGVAYVVRGLGDALGDRQPDGYTVVSAWPTWLSPIGWVTEMRQYEGDRWWVLVLPLVTFAASVGVAFALTVRRDVGMGMVPDRRGPARATPALLSPLGLAWRLQRGTLLGWTVAMVAYGAAVGSLSQTVQDALGENEGTADTIAKLAGGGNADLMDAFFAAMMAIYGAMAAGYVVQALMRPRSEEAGGPAEAVLATGTGRLTWLASHLAVAVGGAAVLLVAAGAATGLVDGLSSGGAGGKVLDMTGAALVQLPAALILAGFAVAVFGLLPRLAVGLAWAAFTVSLIVGQLGELLGLPQAVRDISPFTHVPAVPAASATALPLIALTAVAVALGAAGLALFRRRDLVL
ncbi:ABC transporter permease [Phytohabitans suffuscus]|uniref:Exporter of polyketide antibiotics n=1 Tax=Phytohabitans suffuscus TaxID=624315 RepID=A0A6F8YMM0_9ACTN|nr:anibiotic ABC transporter [Phytohabitans suffuscus]BCB87286.1 exporter of polyketide antibiotics [Phytohabitans suffuscus]